MSSKPDRYSPRQSRHLDYISQFTSDIRHVPGSDNAVADALSRLPVNALHTGNTTTIIDFQAMAAAQLEDTHFLITLCNLKIYNIETQIFSYNDT